MSVKAGCAAPLVHVKEIENSIRFYERLGFETILPDRCEPLGWARLHCEGGAIMFVRTDHAEDPKAQVVLFYMCAPDLPALREQLLASGVQAPAIQYPGYMPNGELRLDDVDGYVVLIGHWGRGRTRGLGKARRKEGLSHAAQRAETQNSS